MYTSFTSQIGRSARRRMLPIAVLLTVLLTSVMTLLLILPAPQVAGQSQAASGFYNDLRGSDPSAWTTSRLDSTSLLADPSFVYQTVFNGAEFDSGRDEVVDESGNAYVLARAYDTSNDVMVVKFSPSGAVLFVTYLRGSLTDYGTGLTLDGQGGLLVAGFTDSTDFPVVDAAQPVKDNNRSAFLARLSTADGAVVYSSFFGANRADEFHDVAVNATGEIFLVGKTDSTDFPTLNPIQANLNLTNCFCDDAFILRLSADAHSILYSTYLGGEFDDQGDSIGLDAAGNIYVAGITKSDLFPIVNPIQSERGGDFDVWAARISADGANLDYSTYLGGSKSESLARIAVDPAGYTTLAGSTNSSDFPSTSAAYQPVFGGGLCGVAGFGQRSCSDSFITRLLPDGSDMAYSTFLGGGNDDEGRGVMVDDAGNAYIVGYSYTTDVPPNVSIYVNSLDASGSHLRFSVQEFSAVANDGHGIALGPDGDVYFTGAKNAPADLYAARLSESGGPSPTPTPTPIPPTPTPPSSDGSMHVGDLDGSASGSRRWRATVSVLVHNSEHNPMANVTVRGAWSGGYSKSAQCVTAANGICTLTTRYIRRKTGSVTFTVDDLTQSGYIYDSAANHDLDGDSNGTSIVILGP